MSYISLFKTKTDELAIVHETFQEALNLLNQQVANATESVLEAVVLKEGAPLEDSRSTTLDIVASLRTIR